MAFALALLLRNTALTITVFVAAPVAMGALSQFGELLEKITAWLRSPGASLQTILSTQKDGQTPDATLWGQFTVGIILWIVIPLAIGLWGRRLGPPVFTSLPHLTQVARLFFMR